jgi:hypothetical protein
MRQLVANNIQKLINKQNSLTERDTKTIRSKRRHLELNTIKSLKHKINQNQQIITKADKGKTLVMLHKEEYNNRIEDFITKISFTELSHITNIEQQNIRNITNKCNKVININNKWRYINMNPTVKLHKLDKPIRPIVNWKNSPGYKSAKHIDTLLNKTLSLPNAFNVQNSYNLTQSQANNERDENIKLCSFDIKDIFTNISTTKFENINNLLCWLSKLYIFL